MCQEGEAATANDPNQWDKDDFRDLKSDGFPLSTKTQNASQTGGNNNTANVTFNTTNTAATSKTKLYKLRGKGFPNRRSKNVPDFQGDFQALAI